MRVAPSRPGIVGEIVVQVNPNRVASPVRGCTSASRRPVERENRPWENSGILGKGKDLGIEHGSNSRFLGKTARSRSAGCLVHRWLNIVALSAPL